MNVKIKETEKIQILNSDDLYGIMQRVLLRENKIDRNKEHFWVVGLSASCKILYIELISLGTVKETLVDPMEVFSIALQKRTVNVIFVHNHPSGSLQPSDADKDLTDKLIQVGLFLKVPVLDHLIITEKSYYSFSENGLLAELAESKKYGLPYQEKERIKKESEALGEEKGVKRVARELKAKGMEVQDIAKVTGLSTEEIKRLRPQKPKEE